MANPIALPGAVVASGSLLSPGGAQGLSNPVAVSGDAGNIAKIGSDGQILVPFVQTNYYGVDNSNNSAYAVTVASTFVLAAGVIVSVTPTNANSTANPTLNVNGTGVKNIVNRANIQLSASEISPSKTFSVMYDGSSWRVITPLSRYTTPTASGAISIECLGYDHICIYLVMTGALNITLAHLALAVPVFLQIFNNGAAANYTITSTTETGANNPCWWSWANSLTAPPGLINLATANALAASGQMLFIGENRGAGGVIFL